MGIRENPKNILTFQSKYINLAGSFDAYKVKVVLSTEVTPEPSGFSSTPSTTFFYYADGVGLVKSERVDADNKITSTDELKSKSF